MVSNRNHISHETVLVVSAGAWMRVMNAVIERLSGYAMGKRFVQNSYAVMSEKKMEEKKK